jgi:hypothetical protein
LPKSLGIEGIEALIEPEAMVTAAKFVDLENPNSFQLGEKGICFLEREKKLIGFFGERKRNG